VQIFPSPAQNTLSKYQSAIDTSGFGSNVEELVNQLVRQA